MEGCRDGRVRRSAQGRQESRGTHKAGWSARPWRALGGQRWKRMAGEFMSTESLGTCLGRGSRRGLFSLVGATMAFGKCMTEEDAEISRASSLSGKRTMEGVSATAAGIESDEG